MEHHLSVGGNGFYQDELAAAPVAVAGSSVVSPGSKGPGADGRGLAAAAHGLPIIAFGPMGLLLLGVFILIRRDPRRLVQDATHDAARFDVVAVPLFIAFVVLSVVSSRTEDLGFIGAAVVGLVFVSAHLFGVARAWRGQRFRYPLPGFLRRD